MTTKKWRKVDGKERRRRRRKRKGRKI